MSKNIEIVSPFIILKLNPSPFYVAKPDQKANKQ
jgi:hypothetical protein